MARTAFTAGAGKVNAPIILFLGVLYFFSFSSLALAYSNAAGGTGTSPLPAPRITTSNSLNLNQLNVGSITAPFQEFIKSFIQNQNPLQSLRGTNVSKAQSLYQQADRSLVSSNGLHVSDVLKGILNIISSGLGYIKQIIEAIIGFLH